MDNLKNKIEKEINDINNLYDKTINDITNSFLEKHEKLLKEENDIKEKLQIEITKTKEKLENFLSQTRGIKNLEKEEKNMVKHLNYISKINKNLKQMKILSNELMKSLKFYYDKNESNNKYEEFYFNGFPNPKNIQIKDIKHDSFNINWEIDTINNIDYNQMKYIVEIKKENEKFNKIYENNEKNCFINNLSEDTNYEFRVCSFYNNSYGLWSEIKKVKTEVNSIILNESQRKNEFIQKILEWSGYKKMELIYRGSRDGTKSKNFHDKCDNKGPTIVLCKNDKGNIFGGYCPIHWKSEGGFQSNSESFIFTLTNIYNIEPTKFNRGNDQNHIYFGIDYGAWFGNYGNVGFYQDYSLNNNCYCTFGQYNSYIDSLGKGKSIFTGNLNNNNNQSGNYKFNEIETFKLYK